MRFDGSSAPCTQLPTRRSATANSFRLAPTAGPVLRIAIDTDGSSVTIRAASPGDAITIATIYNHYIADTIVTFEEEPVTAEDIAQRMEDVRAAEMPWLVAEEGSVVVGYAYASPWAKRIGYR